ncbi:MAG: phage major capsid protein, partial [Candidatus Heimdallarchaeota archaeon]
MSDDLNKNEFNANVDEFKKVLQSVSDITTKTSDEVKTIKDASAADQQAHANALKDLDGKLAKLEKNFARKPNVSDNEGLSAENIKRFNAVMQNCTNQKKNFDPSQAKLLKETYDALLTKGHERLTDEQKSVVNTIVSTEGGYLTVPDYDQEIINKKFDVQGVLGLINIKNTSTGTLHQSIDYADYDSWEYINELANSDPDEHVPNYKQVVWNATEQIFKFVVSRSELEDALINVETDIIGKAREGAIRQTGAQILLGNGVNRPKGILDYASGTGWNEIERVTGTAQTAISWEDLITLLPAKLSDPYHDNASYAMRRETFFGLLSATDGLGQLNIMNQVNFYSGDGVGMNILGKPVAFDSGIQDVSTGGNDAVIYGDFNEA